MTTPWWLPFGHVAEVTPSTLAAALASGSAPQLLDVRTAAEFAAGHIPGARNLPITSLSSRLLESGLEAGRPIVAICLSAHRSIPAVRLLRRHGFEAAQLAGGMLAWRALGLPETTRSTTVESPPST